MGTVYAYKYPTLSSLFISFEKIYVDIIGNTVVLTCTPYTKAWTEKTPDDSVLVYCHKEKRQLEEDLSNNGRLQPQVVISEHDISKGIDVPKGGSYPLDVPSLKFLRLSG